MMLVKTYVAKSSIAGLGLFAYDFIPEGTKIWEYTSNIDIELPTLDSFDGVQKEFLETYCYRYKDKYILCVDNARFINHCINPNTDDTMGPYTIASKDIHPGQEITSNYEDFGASEDDYKFNIGDINLN